MSLNSNKGFSFAFLLITGAVFALFGAIMLKLQFTKTSSAQMQNYVSFNSDGSFDEGAVLGEFHGRTYEVPPKKDFLIPDQILEGKNANKRIEVDLTNQKLLAFVGNLPVYEFPISSGKWGRTPTGDFEVWSKFKYVLMAGGSKEIGTYYYLPNVPFTMFFEGDNAPRGKGFGIHGTYWHDNFGHPMSHGCINMRTEDAELLFYWAKPKPAEDKNVTYASNDTPGTKIKIYGEAPFE